MNTIIKTQDPDWSLERAAAEPKKQNGDFAAAMGSVVNGRLAFTRGASQVTLSAKPDLLSLYQAHFEGHVPDVRVQEGKVTIRYPHLPLLGWLIYQWRQPAAEIALNASIPWNLDFRGGISQLTANLTRATLGSIEMRGGVSQARLSLPHPTETVSVRFIGGASHVWLKRPSGTAVRVHIGGGVDRLAIDGQRFGPAGNGLRWETEDYPNTTHRYNVEILGGASHITIGVE